jgi:hypothetical protein
VAAPSTIYFPLRSNAASLITGRGVGDVRRRLMLASLLHDEVWIEAGLLSVMAGSDGSNAWHTRGIDPASVSWQSPRARNQGEGQEFGLAFGIEILADRQVVCDQLVDRDLECIEYPLRG